MASNAKNMFIGLFLTAAFFAVLVVMFMHIYPGKDGENVNAFTYSDNLFNSMAKGSTNYIPELQAKAAKVQGKSFDLVLEFHDGAVEGHETYQAVAADVVRDSAVILGTVATVEAQGEHLKVSGDLGAVLLAGLADAEAMFNNDGAAVKGRYNMDERRAMFLWWKVLREMQRQFTLAKDKPTSDLVKSVVNKGVEVGYNFYGISPEKVSDKAGILVFALVFYVVYTLWWGIAIMEIFTGLGLKMTKGAKKEV